MESKLAFDYLQRAVDECMNRVRRESDSAIISELSDFYCYLVDLQFDLYRSTGGNRLPETPSEPCRVIPFPLERRDADMRSGRKKT